MVLLRVRVMLNCIAMMLIRIRVVPACLDAVLQKLSGPLWQDADAVILSDFIAQRLPETLVKRVRDHQSQQLQRFHAIAMSDHGKPGIMRIFDHIWRFDTGLKSRLLRRWKR